MAFDTEAIEKGVRLLKEKGLPFEGGLSDGEISCIEGSFQLTFPPDVRYFLQLHHQTAPYFVNWRGRPETVRHWFNRISEGVLFDVEHSQFWSPDWGARPSKSDDAVRLAEELLMQAPRLIPIGDPMFVKCIPAVPNSEGNPVFSIRQTDVLHAGRDIADFLKWFGRPKEEFERDAGNSPTPLFDNDYRFIPFWTEMVRRNASA